MKNIHILPTDKPSRLVRNHTNKLLLTMQYLPLDKEIYCFPQNIYITSDEEIKNCYYFNSRDNAVRKNNNLNHPYHHKIILTDNKDLIKDGVQAIDDEFLEWFVNNPNCDEVEVRKIEDKLISPKNPKIRFNALQDPPSFISAESLNNMILTYKYEIIIPKEEPEQLLLQSSIDGEAIWVEPKKIKNKILSETSEETKQKAIDYGNSLVTKQKTLEELAERLTNDFPALEVRFNMTNEDIFIWFLEALQKGAKWQQEQILDFLYSEITERRDYSASKMCEKVIEFTKNK